MEGSRFEEMCHHHYAEVVRVAFLVTGDRQEALDVAQETFARAYERWGQVSTMDSPVGWLMRVATNLSLSHRRRAVRRAPSLPPPESTDDAHGDPAVLSALASLTPSQRAAVVLRFYLDLSIGETARMLRKRPGTIRALTSQGVARLRQLLGDSWLEVRDE
jgi:RNA polymerase sigma factor (sigma-70 family)